jgi:hypothetical protein
MCIKLTQISDAGDASDATFSILYSGDIIIDEEYAKLIIIHSVTVSNAWVIDSN